MEATIPPKSAVFLDRDGTINQEVEYLSRYEDLEWIPGAIDAIKKLNDAGILVIVVTNQAGIAHGYFDEEDVLLLHREMNARLRQDSAWIDAFYFCPYHAKGRVEAYRQENDCRKPNPGMIFEAIGEWNIDATTSFLVGDKNSDIEAGKSAGLATWLVLTGYGRVESTTTTADRVVPGIREAVNEIVDIWTMIR